MRGSRWPSTKTRSTIRHWLCIGYRAWKGFDWEVLGRLHEKGMIDDPVGKVKSVAFTDEGLERAKRLFKEMFEE